MADTQWIKFDETLPPIGAVIAIRSKTSVPMHVRVTEKHYAHWKTGPVALRGREWAREETQLPPFPDVPASDIQIGGDHYKTRAIQPWDYVAANNLGFFEGNVVKYVTRWKDKGGLADLKKARHYLDKLIELQGETK